MALVAVIGVAAALAGGAEPQFEGTSRPIEGKIRERIVGSSWHHGCPVGIGRLRLLDLTYRDFDGDVRHGRLVVNRSDDDEIIAVFKRLFKLGYPIRRMELVDRYGADDHRSMAADNTSAFNCRFVAGTTRWSEHAYGRAIDINPIENPYVSGGRTSHPASVPYLDRGRVRPDMAIEGRALVRAFDNVGWGWGGRWSGGTRDLQHFSPNGR